MIVYYCFLEVFDEEIGKWEHVNNPNQHPEDLHYGQFFTEMDRESLFFFFQDVENQQEAVLLTKWKGLPNDASNFVKNQYIFYLKKYPFVMWLPLFYLNEISDFEYDSTFNLYKLPKWEYKIIRSIVMQDKLKHNRKQISYKSYLGDSFFEDLNAIKNYERFGKC